MEITFEDNVVSFTKVLSKLDELALCFSESLSKAGIKHVFLSGYLAILFGRNRASEDIDVVCERVTFEIFTGFWKDIHETFECIITSDIKTAFDDYLSKGTALRFARKGKFIPNVEMKFETTELHKKALLESLKVVVNGRNLPISPLEQQIAYKLYMRSEKDIEDARFLFKLFEENLDKEELIKHLEALEVSKTLAKQYLGWSD